MLLERVLVRLGEGWRVCSAFTPGFCICKTGGTGDEAWRESGLSLLTRRYQAGWGSKRTLKLWVPKSMPHFLQADSAPWEPISKIRSHPFEGLCSGGPADGLRVLGWGLHPKKQDAVLLLYFLFILLLFCVLF